jgi:hypothetical protein
MARETKAQRDARYDAERDARLAVAKATYPQRLMAVLERATKMNFELSVMNSEFRVEDRDDRRADMYLLPYEFSTKADDTLQSLEWEVESKEEARAEAERRATVRSAALNKLSAEEREVLGL